MPAALNLYWSPHKNSHVVSSRISQLFVWLVLIFRHYMGDFEALLLNNWTCTESHGHSVCCNARCRLCVPCILYTQAFVYTQACCEVCLCVFPGCVLLHICAGWVMGIPCLHSPAQPASDCSVGWTPSRLHIKTLCLVHMEQLRPATRSLFHLTALGWVFFFPSLQLLLSFILAAGMLCVGVLTRVFVGDV